MALSLFQAYIASSAFTFMGDLTPSWVWSSFQTQFLFLDYLNDFSMLFNVVEHYFETHFPLGLSRSFLLQVTQSKLTVD